MNLLVLTDFSDSAYNALAYAVQFFQARPANFHLVHICDPQDLHGGPDDDDSDMEMRILGMMDSLIKQIQKQFPKVEHTYQGICERKPFLAGVKEEIRLLNVDLIVMGQKGAGARKGISLGSHAYEVATRIKKPLLLIPEGIAYQEAASLAFSTDYNFHFKNGLLDELTLLQDLSNAHLRIIHPNWSGNTLSAVQQANKDHIASFVKDRFHSFHAVDCDNLEEGLQQITQEYPVGLLLFPAKNVNYFEAFVTSKSRALQMPVVLLHD